MNTKFIKIGSIVLVVLIVIGIWLKWASGFEETDNAQVSAHSTILSAQVGGIIEEVLIEENQKVKFGQVLVKLDQRDLNNRHKQLQAELKSLDAKLSEAKKEYERSKNLFKDGAISAQEKDEAQSRFEQAAATHDSITSQIDQSFLNLEHSEVKAPADGLIGKKSAEKGMVISQGQQLMSFVDARIPWITANFKETQLKKMKLGQKVRVSIDAIGGKEFEGEVESIAPGTGATFALIPPDNATGNFTKIVQRVPVRIKLYPASLVGFEDRIVPGLSAVVKVHLK
jgi:membrane fusion protein (multidrug efflux system)